MGCDCKWSQPLSCPPGVSARARMPMEKPWALHYCSVLTQPWPFGSHAFFPITSGGPPPAHKATTVSGETGQGLEHDKMKGTTAQLGVGKLCASGHWMLTLSRPRTARLCIFPASFNAHSMELSLWPSYLHIRCNPSLF